MTTPGLKNHKYSDNPRRDSFSAHSPRSASWGAGSALLECDQDHPPRLCRRDLKDPERFHQRLIDWLMKQR